MKYALNSKLFDNIVTSLDLKKIKKPLKNFATEILFLRSKKFSINYVPKLSATKHTAMMSEKHYKKHCYVILMKDLKYLNF